MFMWCLFLFLVCSVSLWKMDEEPMIVACAMSY